MNTDSEQFTETSDQNNSQSIFRKKKSFLGIFLEAERKKSSDENSADLENGSQPNEESKQMIQEIEKSIDKTIQIKEQATVKFKNQEFDEAFSLYEEAIRFCPLNDAQMLTILNSNISICFLRKSDYDGVIHYTTEALKSDPNFTKALLNRAAAYEKTEKIEEAFEGEYFPISCLIDYKKLEELDPKNKEIRAKRAYLEIQAKEIQERKKKEVLTGLKDLGNTLLGKFGLSLDNFKLQQNDNGSYNIQFKQ